MSKNGLKASDDKTGKDTFTKHGNKHIFESATPVSDTVPPPKPPDTLQPVAGINKKKE